MAETAQRGPLGGLREAAERNPATAQLVDAAQEYLQARVQHTVTGLAHKLGETTARLSQDPAGAVGQLASAGQKIAQGKSPARAALEVGASSAKDKVFGGLKEKLGGLFGKAKRGRGGGAAKVVTIVEDIDVGVPVRVAYDQWTQYQEFGNWAKGVKSVENADDTTTNWKLKVFWSNRSWKANVTEQVPDQRIVWTTEGAKGTTKGVVTFHPLGDTLTKVLLVIEYYPSGLFEKTGNIWKAQGRRARLDLKLYRRFVMMRGEATGAWRGEISDGEVVRSHEDAIREEEEAEQAEGADEGEGADKGEESPDVADEAAYADEAEDDEDAPDEAEAEYEDEEYGDEDGYDEDEFDDADFPEEATDESELDESELAEDEPADDDEPEPEDERDEAEHAESDADERPADRPRRRARGTAGARAR